MSKSKKKKRYQNNLLVGCSCTAKQKGKVLQAILKRVMATPSLDITCLEGKVMGSESAQKTDRKHGNMDRMEWRVV